MLKTRWRHGPGDHGADLVFQCRGKPEALHAALRAVRPQGSVIDLAFYTARNDSDVPITGTADMSIMISP